MRNVSHTSTVLCEKTLIFSSRTKPTVSAITRAVSFLHYVMTQVYTSQAVLEKCRIRQAEQTRIRHMYTRVHASSHTTLDVYKNGNSLSSAHTHTYSHVHPAIATIHSPLPHIYCQRHGEYCLIGRKSYTVLLHSDVLFCTEELSFRCLGK